MGLQLFGTTSSGVEKAIAGNAGEVGKVLKSDDPFVKALASAPTKPGQAQLVPGLSGLIWIDKNGRLPLKAFGAKWDGESDDGAHMEEAIKVAVETGMEIQLPSGTGVIDSTPAIPKNLTRPVIVRGAGERDTIVKLKTSLQFLKFEVTAKGDTVGNTELYDFTVDGNNKQVAVAGSIPVVLGNNLNSQEQVNIANVKMRNIRTVNVPTLEKQENARRNVVLQVYQAEPGLAKNTIDNIDIRDCDFGGGQYGVFIAGIKGGGPLPLNVYLGRIRIKNIKYAGPKVPEAFGPCAGVQIGQLAWSDGKDIVLEDIYSENSADVSAEIDVPCTVRGLTGVNGNNSNLLLNTFNPTTTSDPIVSKLTVKAEVGATKLEVSSTVGFVVGERIVLYGADVSSCETRTIKAIGAGYIELTEAIAAEAGFALGTWLSQVDVTGGKMYVENFTSIRTAQTPGSQRGLALQNVENVIPAPVMEVNGYTYRRSWKGVPNAGEVIASECGTALCKSGNPRAVRVRRMQVDITNVEHSAAGQKAYGAIRLKLNGLVCPVELQGAMSIAGPGVTNAGTMPANIVQVIGKADLDFDLHSKVVFGSTGGQPVRFVTVNQETAVGSALGRIRQRVRPSSVTAGGGVLTAVRFGKGCGFGSDSVRTKTTAIVAAAATSFEVASTEGFTIGMAIVLDAESAAKSEVFSIEKIEGTKIFIVPVLNVGTAAEHAAGAVVARLNHFVVEDSDFAGVGTEGVGIAHEDTKVGCRLMVRGSIQPKPTGSSAVAIPESGKIQQVLQAGQSGILQIKGGTITKVEYSANGSSFFQVASSGNVGIPVNPGDFFKLTYTVAPEAINFIPARV